MNLATMNTMRTMRKMLRGRGQPGGDAAATDVRTMLFTRDFVTFTGGHLKVWHYYNHVLAHPRFDAAIRFTDRSVWDSTNPWDGSDARVVRERERFPADVLFLGGLDWLRIPERQRKQSKVPVLNIIQAVHHAKPGTPRYDFLPNRAVRICVSSDTTDALAASGRCNGPLVTIANGIELDDFPAAVPGEDRPFDLLIAGKKQPQMARSLAARLERPGRRIRVMDEHVPHRRDTIDAINQARVTLFLPNRSEGFYLPAVEGMALRSVVVCPDVVGNRSFCLAGTNCFFPDFNDDSILDATEAALALSGEDLDRMLAEGSATAAKHDMARERSLFYNVLDHLDELYWHG